MKHCLRFALYFGVLLIAVLDSSNAAPQKDAINKLEAILTTLSNYDYGDVETGKPELIEVMRSIYQQPDTQTKAATMMLAFLNSEASSEAKKTVRSIYYSLADETPKKSDHQDFNHESSASSLMIEVAGLIEDFKRSKQPLVYLKRRLRTESNELRPHVIRLVRALPDTYRKGISLIKIDGLNSHNKAQLLKILAVRKDPSIHDLVTDFAQDEDPLLRAAALESLQSIGKAKDAKLLTEIALTWDDPEKSLSRNALYRMPGKDVDLAISSLLNTESTLAQLELILAIEKRNIKSATSQLIEIASKEGEPQSRAIRAIAITAPVSSLDSVIDLLVKTDSSKQKKELETAIYRIAFRHADDSEASTIIRTRMLSSKNSSVRDSLSSILEKLTGLK